MQDLKISLIQSPLYWQDIPANLAMFEEKIWTISGETDIVLLPEMFNTGFTMHAEAVAEPMNSRTFRWMKQMAAQIGALILGSFVVRDGQNLYNRLLWMQPDGTYHFYDKRHLFRMALEHEHYKAGTKKLISEWKGWKICPLVCYDLRFPVWSRNVGLEYDLLIYVANWPQARVSAWDILLKGRAIENLCYVAGLNRTGTDGNDIPYNGHSAVIDPKGNYVMEPSEDDFVKTIILNGNELLEYRRKFPAHLDADDFRFNYQA